MAIANSAILLGLASTIIYFGVTEKVAWNFAGGYLGTVFNMIPAFTTSYSNICWKTRKGGTFGVLIGVLILGFIPVRTKKVAQDDVELYWRSLKYRESRATTKQAQL